MTEKALASERKSASSTSKASLSSRLNSARFTAYMEKWCARLMPYSRRCSRVSAAMLRAEVCVRSQLLVLVLVLGLLGGLLPGGLSGVWGAFEVMLEVVSSSVVLAKRLIISV